MLQAQLLPGHREATLRERREVGEEFVRWDDQTFDDHWKDRMPNADRIVGRRRTSGEVETVYNDTRPPERQNPLYSDIFTLLDFREEMIAWGLEQLGICEYALS